MISPQSPRSYRLIRRGWWRVLVVLFIAAIAIVLFVVRKNPEEASVAALQEMRAHIGFIPRQIPWWAQWLVSQRNFPRSRRLVSVEWPNGSGTDNMLFELSQLEGLTDLAVLRLARGEVSDTGLSHITGLSKLKCLDLSGTRVTDAGLVHLSALPELQVLNLEHTAITDRGLSVLAKCRNLRTLSLGGDNISDAGLVSLKPLTDLKELSLSGTHVTDKGVAALKKALPELVVAE